MFGGVATSVGCYFPGGSQPPILSIPQHISSRRHRDGVAGKPNPLLSRHKKPRGTGELAVRPGRQRIRPCEGEGRNWGEKAMRAGLGRGGVCEPLPDFSLSPPLSPQQGTLTFSKELPKSLAGGLLPSPLAVAAVMAAAAGSPLSLRPAPAAPLLQGPPITHPLLHPAPGPIRTAHGPILFSPY